MHRRTRLCPWLLAAVAVMGFVGCQGGDSSSSDGPAVDDAPLLPVRGTITLEGKPLAHAVVTFLPESGLAGVGETGEDGSYTLKTATKDGLKAGDYKVAVSYLVSAEGEPQGLGPRNSIAVPKSMLTATEKILPEYADLGRTTLTAKVEPGKTMFTFDVKGEAPKVEDTSAKKAETKPDPVGEKAEKKAETSKP